MAEYVWYAGYGSNLNNSRFHYYVKGGIFKVTGRNHPGCQDQTFPIKVSRCTIDHELYFARKSSSWENKAVAFLAATPNKAHVTKCVLYLITREQFTDILIQENSSVPPMPGIVPNLEAAKRGEEVMVGMTDQFSWYGRLLYLGEHEGYPIYSFTSKDTDESIVVAEPGANYLQVIGTGLVNNFGMSQYDAASYLMQQRGISNTEWTIEGITNLINKPHEY